MSELGKSFEVFQPRTPPETTIYGFFTLVTAVLTFALPGILSALFFLGTLFLGVTTAWKLSRRFCGVWFHQGGLRVKSMGSLIPGTSSGFWFEESLIPIDTLEDFRWDADDVEQVEDGNLDRWQDITFLISWTDSDDHFHEIQFSESFEPGSIRRLHRATPRLEEMAQESESQDEYWDE